MLRTTDGPRPCEDGPARSTTTRGDPDLTPGGRPFGVLVPSLLVALWTFGSATAEPAAAQSVLERTPNISGAWVGSPATLYFNFLHRFDPGDAPTRKVKNSPTFLLGWGFGGYALIGAQYATASELVANHPNEWEIFGRVSPLSTEFGAAFDIGLTAAYNEAAESLDGELSLGVPFGPLKVLGVVRGFSDAFGEDDFRWVVGGGARLKLTDNLALATDIVQPAELRDGEQFGWGAAVQIAIPYTPHTLSLQAANTNSSTLQGSSIRSGKTRYGFEFTIPFTPARYFGGEGARPALEPGARLGETDLVASDTVRVSIREFEFSSERIAVLPGTYVVWTNEGEVLHSSTSDGGMWNSPVLGPGESYGRVFTEVGEFPYHCTPHPFMTGTIVVRQREEER